MIYWEEDADPLEDTPTVLVIPTRLVPLTLYKLHHMVLGTYLTQGYITYIDPQFVLIKDDHNSIRVEIITPFSMDWLHEYVELTIEKTHQGLHLVSLEQRIDTKESYIPMTFTLPEDYEALLSCESRIINLKLLTILAMTEMRRHYIVEVSRGSIVLNLTLPKQLNNTAPLHQALTLAMSQGPVTLTHVLCLSGTNLTFTSHSTIIDVP